MVGNRNWVVVILLLLTTSCGSTRTYSEYAVWDRNGDSGIQRSEFVQGFLANNSVRNWNATVGSVTAGEFAEKLFYRMDHDNSGTLSEDEFKMKVFSFGMVGANLSSWDSDSNNFLVRDEFIAEALKSQLFNLWDTSGDKVVSERELAGGMFYVCDQNKDHQIDQQEFNDWRESIK